MGWLTGAEFVSAVEAAVRAPSMLNSQPWRFRLGDGGIDLLVDPRRHLPAVDVSGWAARIGCGAALFNLRLALAVRGKPVTVRLLPDHGDPCLLARLTPQPSRPPTPAQRRLYRAIPRRHSNRAPFTDKPVPVPVRAQLVDAARAEDARLDLLVGPVAVEAVALLVRSAHDRLDRDVAYQAELSTWINRPGTAVDGIAAGAGGPVPGPGELLPRRGFGGPDLPAHRDYEREPLLAVLSVAGDWPGDQVQAGQALQRVLLVATELGLAASMFSQPIEVVDVREQLRRVVGGQALPQMLLRFGYATTVAPSPRRPAAEVIVA